MAFDKDCKTYWCSKCLTVEMQIDWGSCTNDTLVFTCPKCEFHDLFVRADVTDGSEEEELYDARTCPNCPAEMVCLGEVGIPGETAWECRRCNHKESID